MYKYKFFVFLFYLIILQANVLCEIEPKKISIGSSEQFELNEDNSFNQYFILEYDINKINDEYLIISTIPEDYLTPGYIYASFDDKNPSIDSNCYSSQILGKNSIYINSYNLTKSSQLYINVHSLKESTITLENSLTKNIFISPEEKKINFKFSEVQDVFLPLKDIKSNKIILYGLGENINDFNMKIVSGNEDEYSEEMIDEQIFDNGLGAIITFNEESKIDKDFFYININVKDGYKDKKLEVGFDSADEADNNIIEINILEHVYGAVQSNENCYKIKNVKNNKYATILINAYTQDLTFTLKNNETKIYSLDVFNNYFIKLPENYSDEGNYFCFKKFTPKEKEKEELGPASYDFQIYYDEDLPFIQSYLMPLINGKVYTHSLNSGDIFVYRCNSFSNLVENNIYSANLLTIRGKPKMYGYLCKTYPDCNIDETKFNELKKNKELDIINPFNQYFINKKSISLDKINNKSEPIYENKNQYLTIIKCETPDDYPNYGECKYSIEINNEVDEIQLAPEIVFATSIISKENKFLIKVSDYKNIQYLKISFTVLTGNAEIYLNDGIKYNKRNVHRKEIITITEALKEKYILTIISYEPSFIELKYETDFYFRGYTMMNPNEVNIEYVNKQNNFMPFEIQNPDYLYPRIDPRNNDFYFTINSLDCILTYNYNYKDYNNITTIHHEVKKDNINFGTSYAFMLKVEEYYHTVIDNNKDCAVIIYTGEKNENIPLLIISDMPHPSDFDETFYIYPFIFNSEFKGIFIDIKFDYESLIQMENSPLVEVILKIGNQNKDFDKYMIKKDYTFFIDNDKAKNYCNSNLQCSLIIELRKIYGEKESRIPYTIKTNVYNAKISPEYIFKNKIYNYKIFPNGSKYFYTQIDLNEEGEINFMFNKGNSKIFAKIVENDKIEEKHNWNGRIKLPESDDQNLLNYDSINGAIKYTNEITKKCVKGCELYIQIKSEEKTKRETEFTDVSFSINQKLINSVEMKLNEYIKGNLEINDYKYYYVIIPEDYLKISINLYSPYGKAIIKYNNSKDENEWELKLENVFGRIIIDCKDEKINKKTLKGVVFTIGITNKDNLPKGELNDYLYYYLQIQGLYNNEKSYYDLTSERSIICDTEKENYCHILLYLNHYYSKNSLIYASSLLNNDNINIYANYYISNEIDELLYKNSIQEKFPTNRENQQNSNGKKFLLFESSKINEINDIYVFLTIDTGKSNRLIKLVLSGADVTQTLLPYNNDRLLLLNKNKIDFILQNNEINYILNIKPIKGESNLNINKEDYNINKDYYIEFKPNENNSFSINSDKESIILLNNEKKTIDKVYELSMDNTEINLNLIDENFTQYSYNKLNKILNNKIKEIKISLNNIKYKDEKIGDDIFDMYAHIINEELLNSLILDPKKEIKKDKININYDKATKIGIVDISNEQINDERNYIFIVINKSSDNKNKYKTITFQYIIIEKEKENKNDKNSDSEKGYGWAITLIVIFIICVILIVILYILKKRRLQSLNATEKEINKMDMPLNEGQN